MCAVLNFYTALITELYTTKRKKCTMRIWKYEEKKKETKCPLGVTSDLEKFATRLLSI